VTEKPQERPESPKKRRRRRLDTAVAVRRELQFVYWELEADRIKPWKALAQERILHAMVDAIKTQLFEEKLLEIESQMTVAVLGHDSRRLTLDG
jgi:hypothetical protein